MMTKKVKSAEPRVKRKKHDCVAND